MTLPNQDFLMALQASAADGHSCTLRSQLPFMWLVCTLAIPPQEALPDMLRICDSCIISTLQPRIACGAAALSWPASAAFILPAPAVCLLSFVAFTGADVWCLDGVG